MYGLFAAGLKTHIVLYAGTEVFSLWIGPRVIKQALFNMLIYNFNYNNLVYIVISEY